ncbi:MAG: Glutamyl-tRNA(Gln) amidotransferase subunit C [Alphaproteobacteria bacterium MarineAlpha11_Bin1]|nr:MAG: Glutamyl-tRNA(Gln) amidotransferase subunit C [Alphaproteobacteria bacterium MarineAlpha11_Bin1]|tara:strand:- start:563 stop:850 length:288 start_codon:yes stop_codon:yes gene_type:complete
MIVDRETVVRVARLARLKISEDEANSLAGELSNIIRWIEQLDEVETDGVEPMASVAEMKLRWRTDEVTDDSVSDKVTANAPDLQSGMFSVPKVVE